MQKSDLSYLLPFSRNLEIFVWIPRKRVFHVTRQMADVLFNVGADNFALEIYLKLELYNEAAHVLFKQNKAKFENFKFEKSAIFQTLKSSIT